MATTNGAMSSYKHSLSSLIETHLEYDGGVEEGAWLSAEAYNNIERKVRNSLSHKNRRVLEAEETASEKQKVSAAKTAAKTAKAATRVALRAARAGITVIAT